MNSEKIKKALRIAVNVGCGFEGDAEDAVSLLGLIEANEARIAELEAERDDWRKSYINLWRHINNLPQPPEVQE